MRQAVSFKCSGCSASLKHTLFFVRLQAPTVTTVKRFSSLRCLRAWVRSPRL